MKKFALLGFFALFAGCMGAADEGADPADDQQGAATDTVEGGEGDEVYSDSEEGGESFGTGEDSPVEEEEVEAKAGRGSGSDPEQALCSATDLDMGANTYAFVDGGEGALFVCGESQIFRVTEADGAEPYLDAKCDVITVMGDKLYYNSRTSGQLFHLLLAGNSAEGEPVGDSEASPIRSMSISNQGESSVLFMAQGESGVTQYDPASNEVVTVSTEPMNALHVSSIPGTETVLVGTSTGIRTLGSGPETEILSGATDIGWVEEDEEGNWRFATVNPLGVSVFSLDGSLSSAPVLESTLSPGAHPFVVGKGFASLWSEIVALEWEVTAENQVGLKISGRYAETYAAPGRTVHRHFVDVLSQEDDTVIALHDQGVSWFDVEEQGQEPDIHAKNLVLKMSPPELGGPASVLALIQNKVKAPWLSAIYPSIQNSSNGAPTSALARSPRKTSLWWLLPETPASLRSPTRGEETRSLDESPSQPTTPMSLCTKLQLV